MATKSNLFMLGFDKMLARYGPRHWWPGDTSFEVMVGAILTQNTNWKNVSQAISNLKKENVLEPKKLFKLDPSHLAELIRPAGYFRIKTKRLRNFLKYFIGQYDGCVDEIKGKSTETLREELLSVNGIGPETCDSILLYALDKPIFVIDAYTKRILSRHGVCAEEDGYYELQEMFMDKLSNDVKLFNEYHALIVETAKDFCRTKPKCDECPLKGWNK